MEKAEQSSVPCNLLRTMPYTAYIAALAHGIIFASHEGLLLFVGLISNELLNHLLKFLTKTLVGKTELTKRPAGAMDTGIYPQHNPKTSQSMGMPSGHSQTSAFLATVLLQHIAQSDVAFEAKIRASIFCIIVSLAVMVSRTRHGGILSVHVNGKLIACHTELQVVIGAAIGVIVGIVSFQTYAAQSSATATVTV